MENGPFIMDYVDADVDVHAIVSLFIETSFLLLFYYQSSSLGVLCVVNDYVCLCFYVAMCLWSSCVGHQHVGCCHVICIMRGLTLLFSYWF